MKSTLSNREDRVLLVIVMLLILIGILMVYSSSSFRGAEKYNDSMQFLKSHAVRVAIGLVFLYLFSRIDYHRFRWITPVLLILSIGALVVVLFGPKINGSRRSVQFLGKGLQPSEFMSR